VSLSVVCFACNSAPVSPSPSTASPLTGNPIIGFEGLRGLACAGLPQSPPNPSCVVSSYSQSGVTVTATSGTWSVRTDYGQPAPFIEFYVPGSGPLAAPGTPGTGTLHVTAGGATFSFTSVDLYASLVPIPYQITGLRNSMTVFTLANTLPNTFGNFVTVVNPQASAVIDTLVITLTDGGSAMGLDNVVISANQ
jgi:hypothetical protein